MITNDTIYFTYCCTIIFLQPCPQGSANFRDIQCGQYNGRDIFINGDRAKWMSYVRGINDKLLGKNCTQDYLTVFKLLEDSLV